MTRIEMTGLINEKLRKIVEIPYLMLRITSIKSKSIYL
jgi:hypothetical protein